MKRKLLFVCIAALLSKFAMAQITIGPSIPLGSFGSCDPDDGELFFLDGKSDGGAGVGTALGIHLGGIGGEIATGPYIDFSCDLFWNPLCSDAKDFVDDNISSQVDYKLPYHFNYCFLFGAGYEYKISDNNSLFIHGSLGLNSRYIGRFNVEQSSSLYSRCYFDGALTFAFKVGGGVRLSRNLNLQVNYFNLGSKKVKGSCWGRNGYQFYENEFSWKKLNPQMLTISLGINI